jgi:hypothetical protein
MRAKEARIRKALRRRPHRELAGVGIPASEAPRGSMGTPHNRCRWTVKVTR